MRGQWEPLMVVELKNDTKRAMLQRPCKYHAQRSATAHHDLGSRPSNEDVASGPPQWDHAFSYHLFCHDPLSYSWTS